MSNIAKHYYKLSIDAMGGDHGLIVTIPAALNALKKDKQLHITLCW